MFGTKPGLNDETRLEIFYCFDYKGMGSHHCPSLPLVVVSDVTEPKTKIIAFKSHKFKHCLFSSSPIIIMFYITTFYIPHQCNTVN